MYQLLDQPKQRRLDEPADGMGAGHGVQHAPPPLGSTDVALAARRSGIGEEGQEGVLRAVGWKPFNLLQRHHKQKHINIIWA
jgi:hypothetical protein